MFTIYKAPLIDNKDFVGIDKDLETSLKEYGSFVEMRNLMNISVFIKLVMVCMISHISRTFVLCV